MWIALLTVILITAVYYLDLIPTRFLPRLSNSYQAVFLSNGQVYFGKLYHENSKFSILTNIYYLQAAQSLQPLQEGQAPPANINLVKLGGEMHGPTDEMRINREHILFIEDLKEDSRVLQSIKQLKP